MMQNIHNEGPIQNQINIGKLIGDINHEKGNVTIHINEVSQKLAHTVLFYRIDRTEAGGFQGQLELRSDSLETHQLLDPIAIDIPDRLQQDLQKFAYDRFAATVGRKTLTTEKPNPVTLLQNEVNLGESLYETFFPPQVEEPLLQFKGLLRARKIQSLSLVISSNEERVLNLPFALMRKAGTSTPPLALSHDNFLLVHSKVKSLKAFDVSGIDKLAAPLRILFVTALPENMKEQDKFIQLERETIEFIQALDPLRQQGSVVFEILDIASLENIKDALGKGKHHILHISGHGAHADGEDDPAGFLYLEDENGEQVKVSGEDLAKALAPHSSLKLIMLSACETARAEESGVVGALVKEDLPAVIGMRYPITDPGARLFTQCFYENLCQGISLSRSLFHARDKLFTHEQAQRQKQNPHVLSEWFTPFLYLNQYVGPLIKAPTPGENIPIPPHFQRSQETLLIDGMQIRQGFVGRKRQLARLAQHFRSGRKAVCIYGMGGLGKTALATRFATNYQNRIYKVIQFYGKVETPMILQRLVEEAKTDLGTTQPQLVDQLAQFIKSNQASKIKLKELIQNYFSKKKIILLFDNFETNQEENGEVQERVVNPELAELLNYLFQHLPANCFALLTTRYLPQNLSLTPLNLDEMSLSELYRMLSMEEGLEGRLGITEILSIKEELGGHPFAFDLVKTYLKNNPEASWQELEAQLQTIGNDATSQRKLLLDKLWQLLSPEAQAVLKIAALFRKKFSAQSLEFLSDHPVAQITPALQRLNGLSFCYSEAGDQHYIHRLAVSYVLRTHYEPHELKAAHHQAAEYLVKEKHESLEDYLEALWHYQQAESWEDFADLSFELEDELSLRGHYDLAKQLNQEVLVAPVGENITAIALHNLGIITQHEGDYEQALVQYREAKKILEKIGDSKGLAASLHQIGRIYQDKADYEQALVQYLESKKIREKIGDIKGLAQSLQVIGIIYQEKGDYEQALGQYLEAKKILEKIGDIKGLAQSLHLIGMIYQDKGDYEQALVQYRESKKIKEKIGDSKGLAASLHQIGRIYQDKADYEQALVQYLESKKIREKIGDIKGLAKSLHQIGRIYQEKGDYEQALVQCTESKKISEKIGDVNGLAISMAQIGVLYRNAKQYKAALLEFLQAYTIFSRLGVPMANQAMGDIQQTREAMGEAAFQEVLKELGIESA